MRALQINIFCLFLAACTISALASCGNGSDKNAKQGQQSGPVPVNIDTVHAAPVTYFDEYPANVVALMQVDIHPEVEGYITGIFFKEGSHVTKGQKLYTIDESKYMASYHQAQAGVRVAQANQEQAQKDADRYIYLNEHDAVAQQILDHALVTLANAKSQVASARQDLVKAQTDLNYSTITAPFSGTIGISQVKTGNTVTIGQTTLNTISTDDPMAVDFVVNEKQIVRFRKLLAAGAGPADTTFSLVLPDNSMYGQPGKIYVIDRGVDPTTGTVKVRLEFPNSANLLQAGMSCTVRVRNQDHDPQIMIPGKAVTEQMGEYFVFTVRDSVLPDSTAKKMAAASRGSKNNGRAGTSGYGGTQHVAIQNKVQLGQTIGANVIVLSGLSDNDVIVIDGIQKLHDGSAINPGRAGQQASGH